MNVKAVTDAPWMGRIWAVLAVIVSSYLGVDEYKERTATPTETTVNVNLENAGEVGGHDHGPVLSQANVQAIIDKAIDANNQKLLQTYKKLEPWESN